MANDQKETFSNANNQQLLVLLRVIALAKPKVVIIENVVGILYNELAVRQIFDCFEKYDYDYHVGVLNALHFGVCILLQVLLIFVARASKKSSLFCSSTKGHL